MSAEVCVQSVSSNADSIQQAPARFLTRPPPTPARREAGRHWRDGLGAEYQEQDQPGQIHSGVSDPMHRGYRGIILAFGLILCGASLGPKESAASEKQRATQQEKPTVLPVATTTTEAARAVEPPEYYDPCAQAKNTASSDLCAQWSAAKAAKEAADWAWYQMWLSALGVIGLGITLWFNFRALDLAEKESTETKGALAIAERNAAFAGRAASAASEANSIARDSMQRQLRPFVYVGHPKITYTHLIGFDIIGDTADVLLNVTNHGQTPAYNVRLVARAWVGGIWNTTFERGFDDLTVVHLADIPPAVTKPRDGYTVLGLAEAHKDIIAGVRSVFVEGALNYSDAFGNEYATRFRVASTEGDYIAEKWADCPEGNVAT